MSELKRKLHRVRAILQCSVVVHSESIVRLRECGDDGRQPLAMGCLPSGRDRSARRASYLAMWLYSINVPGSYCRIDSDPSGTYLWLVGNGGMGYNYNYYCYHSSIPY